MGNPSKLSSTELGSTEMLNTARVGKLMWFNAPGLKEAVAKLHLGSKCVHSKKAIMSETHKRQGTLVQLKTTDFLNKAYFNLKKIMS